MGKGLFGGSFWVQLLSIGVVSGTGIAVDGGRTDV